MCCLCFSCRVKAFVERGSSIATSSPPIEIQVGQSRSPLPYYTYPQVKEKTDPKLHAVAWHRVPFTINHKGLACRTCPQQRERHCLSYGAVGQHPAQMRRGTDQVWIVGPAVLIPRRGVQSSPSTERHLTRSCRSTGGLTVKQNVGGLPVPNIYLEATTTMRITQHQTQNENSGTKTKVGTLQDMDEANGAHHDLTHITKTVGGSFQGPRLYGTRQSFM